jgi:hypothetical protein
MPRPKNSKQLTEIELACIANYKGNQVEAARAAGVKNPKKHASAIFKRPRVKAAVEKKIAALMRASGQSLGKSITLSRNDILRGLWKEAREAESDSARVSAWSKLADVFQMVPKGKEVDFTGWFDEELERFVLHGELPKRLFPIEDSTVNGPRADDHGKPTDPPTTLH